jgi:transcriptional regulator with XRE-family HTH domain
MNPLRRRRLDASMSIDDLAEAASVSARTIRRAEGGESFGEATVIAVAKVLDVAASDLALELERWEPEDEAA